MNRQTKNSSFKVRYDTINVAEHLDIPSFALDARHIGRR